MFTQNLKDRNSCPFVRRQLFQMKGYADQAALAESRIQPPGRSDSDQLVIPAAEADLNSVLKPGFPIGVGVIHAEIIAV